MQKITNIIKKTALAIIASVMAAGCISEKYEVSGLQNVMIQINVSSDDEMTKAAATDEMKINSLRIYAFIGNRLCGYHYQGSEYTGPVLMDLELPDGVNDVDFYLIANEAQMLFENDIIHLSENMTRAQLNNVKFTGLANQSALPMYCIETESINSDAVQPVANEAEGHEGHMMLTQSVEFTLQRSLAKLSVYAATNSGSSTVPQILSVELLAKGTREYSYLFPQSASVLDQVHARANNRSFSSSAVNVEKSVSKGSSAASDPANYTEVVSGVYMPEVREGLAYNDENYDYSRFTGNAADESRAAVLHVRYTLDAGQDTQDGYVYLPRIERNHHYKICILINSEGQIILNYIVADWEWDTDKMQNWFFDYPTHTYIWHKIPMSSDDLHSKPESKAVMSESSPFVGYFQMTYPENDQWMPTLTGLHASHCDIKVYRLNDDYTSSQVTPPLAASDYWYRIEVLPNAGDMSVGDVVNLAITYTPSGLSEIEYLLVNGSAADFFWPESTSENYVTITMVN